MESVQVQRAFPDNINFRGNALKNKICESARENLALLIHVR